MSINDFSNKIKVKLDIDKFTFMCLVVIVLVGISSFGLGRLSTNHETEKDEISIVFNEDLLSNNELVEKKYIASRNGKLYYPLNCSGAKRISDKNAIWFVNRLDAEKSGYQFASSCQ